jgi:DNA-binding NtrC family response regulator
VPGTRGGARIEVRLPRADARTPDLPAVVSATVVRAAEPRARLLLVDDEPMLVRSLAQAIDEEHDVVPALGGQAALDWLATDRAFDLIVCDLQMPAVDGVAVHEAIAAHYPALVGRLVIMSGGAVTPRATQFLERARPRVIGKPIVLDHLLAMLRDALAR